MQQVARYEGIDESRIEVESFVHRDATLRGNRESRIEVESFVHRDARYEGIVDYVLRLIRSCNKLHATGKS